MIVWSGQHQMITAGVGFDLMTLVPMGVVSDQEWMLVLQFALVQIGQIIPQHFSKNISIYKFKSLTMSNFLYLKVRLIQKSILLIDRI
jgi:hypothetical protein